MAFADWTYLTDGAPQGAEAYGFGVPSPEPTAGSYARVINGTASTNYGGFVPSNPAFTGVPATYAIRVQSFMYRVGAGGPTLQGANGFLCAKLALPFQTNQGYCFGAGTDNNTLRYEGAGGFAKNLRALGSIGSPSWLSLRMTVYPISDSIDRIVCEEESSPGSGVWSSTFPLGSGIIDIDKNVNPSRYVPWGGTRINGVFAKNTTNTNLFLDKTRVSLSSPVPPPIP